jgi:hypothetical protein
MFAAAVGPETPSNINWDGICSSLGWQKTTLHRLKKHICLHFQKFKFTKIIILE